jgi:hypothetical protein
MPTTKRAAPKSTRRPTARMAKEERARADDSPAPRVLTRAQLAWLTHELTVAWQEHAHARQLESFPLPPPSDAAQVRGLARCITAAFNAFLRASSAEAVLSTEGIRDLAALEAESLRLLRGELRAASARGEWMLPLGFSGDHRSALAAPASIDPAPRGRSWEKPAGDPFPRGGQARRGGPRGTCAQSRERLASPPPRG